MTTETPVEQGEILAGKYRVERVLGEGGMGVVVEATQLGLDRRVAVKFMKADGSSSREHVLARFEREARIAARLRGDHVAQVHDVGRLEDGMPYIVMEYLEGRDLQSVVAERRMMPVPDAVAYLLQACEALAEAHAAGIVHRDLKPANLFLTRRPDGRPLLKLLDFGISKVEQDVSLTATQGSMGSPLYMSPEQLESAKKVTHKTDMWALGVIAYELLASQLPFDAESIALLYTAIITSPPRHLSEVRPDVPPGLAAAVMRCLEKRPDERFPTVADFAVAVAPFARQWARASAKAAVRLIAASTLAHSDLPLDGDSIAPPPGSDPAVPTVRDSVASLPTVPEASAATFAINQSPPSHAETMPSDQALPGRGSVRLIAPVASQLSVFTVSQDPPQPSRGRLILAIAVPAVVVLGIAVFALRGSHTPSRTAQVAPAASTTAPLHENQPAPSDQPAAEPTASASEEPLTVRPAPSASATARARPPRRERTARPSRHWRAPKPAPRKSTTNPDDLLLHRR